MTEHRDPDSAKIHPDAPPFLDFPAPSSLLSSRWPRDNLITSHPAQLYNGNVHEHIGMDSLRHLLLELQAKLGPVQAGACRMGVFTWDIFCSTAQGPLTLQVPLVLDEPGKRDRSKQAVPRHNVENTRYFLAQGLSRFVVEPIDLVTLGGNVPAALLPALSGHHPLTFGSGALRAELHQGERSWAIFLGPETTADLLAEMVAALAYHYEPDVDGGKAITDVYINDGDFVVRRRKDGSFELRLVAIRHREPGISPSRLLLHSLQMMTYEDWSVDAETLVGVPTLLSNPSVAFEGLVRGRRYHARDQGRAEKEGAEEALGWIRDFGRSREGRSYRTWVDAFLSGHLPLAFGLDSRERWWRLVHLEQQHSVLELRARHQGKGAEKARALRIFLDRLGQEIGRGPERDRNKVYLNDLDRNGVLHLLEETRVPSGSREGLAERILSRWPYRSLDHLLARVPGARSLRRWKKRISFGHVLSDTEEGTLNGLEPAPNSLQRPFANPELYGELVLPPALHTEAARTFPSFESYMDAALQDFYGQSVSIGRGGHFSTHPESLSPHYGRWLARCAFRSWRNLLAQGDLTEADPFPVVEFGAGNGRLARDFLDSMDELATGEHKESATWRTFAERVRYHIYEMSPSLREKQRQMLGERACVSDGDARAPAFALRRDFPDGIRGFLLSNEVPDAFGVHKLLLTSEGRAFVTLVIPRLERTAAPTLSPSLASALHDTDTRLRERFGLTRHPSDLYLDRDAYARLTEALSKLPEEERTMQLSALWFEETYVPASKLAELAVHLKAAASEYATALAKDDSGVVLYVNLHACRFLRELAASLAAGVIVTIDYGDTTWGQVQGIRRGDFPFRIYQDQHDDLPKPNDPYSLPGTQDLTADVNFTELARVARDAGLHVLHYSHERDIANEELPDILTASDQPGFAEFLGNPVFKLLVLGTRAGTWFDSPLASPLPLTHSEHDLPESRRHLVSSIRQQLE